MAVDPNDLIIFKVREQQKKRPVEQKVEAKPVKRPEARPVEKPKVVEAPQPKAERKPLFFKQPKPEQAPEERQPVTPVEFARPKREEREQPAYEPKPIQTMAKPEAYTSEEEMQEALINKTAAQTRAEYMSREAAQNLHCTWHPWRKAYARCNYCHRPFCFEDIADYNGNYYCLEDVDKAPAYTGEEKEVYSTYNGLSIVAGMMMLAMFVIFIVFANGQLAYIIGYANAVGIFDFLASINYNYIAALAQGVISVFAIVAAMLLFVQSLRGYAIALLTVFADVAMASYQYLNSGTAYLAVIAGIGFVTVIVLAYSRNNFESAPSSQYMPAEGQEYDLSMPNVGQF
ncbi:MAG: hypothetical protein KGH58_00835 [Candidatus Micrarchaeota archaeon]|nr:hypothetical protein [Candidatus Micrarchaeota archaeon]